MFDELQIDDRRERWLVGLADLALAPIGDIGRWRAHPPTAAPPRRVLLFRLERIGDLLMTLDALALLRARLPETELHLVVGSWNAELAGLIPGIDAVETLDVPWLSRGGSRPSPWTLGAMLARWRRRAFDLAINFEPDIRSNALVGASGAARRVGYASGGGGAFLTDPAAYDKRVHAAVNARRLVERATAWMGTAPVSTGRSGTVPTRAQTLAQRLEPRPGPEPEPDPRPGGEPKPGTGTRQASAPTPQLRIPAESSARAARLLAGHNGRGPLVGLNPGAGRTIKEWPPERFAHAAADLATRDRATIVLLGSAAERRLGEAVRKRLDEKVPLIDLVGQTPLVDLAAVLSRLQVLVTGDTGPMHLAAAVGTPVVGIFGPTDPARYAPLIDRSASVHANLWCRPCRRTRRPPARCRHGVPDCLVGVGTDDVVAAIRSLQVLSRR